MNKTSRLATLVFLLVVACQASDKAKYQIGAPDGPPKVWEDAKTYRDAPLDAFQYKDAHVYEDAKIYEDAKVFEDAPPVYMRSCVNKNPVVFQGSESLTLAIVCASPADAGAVVVTLHGGSGSGAETRNVPMNLVCAPGGMPANNFLQITPVTQQLLATHVAGTLFDLDCN